MVSRGSEVKSLLVRGSQTPSGQRPCHQQRLDWSCKAKMNNVDLAPHLYVGSSEVSAILWCPPEFNLLQDSPSLDPTRSAGATGSSCSPTTAATLRGPRRNSVP